MKYLKNKNNYITSSFVHFKRTTAMVKTSKHSQKTSFDGHFGRTKG